MCSLSGKCVLLCIYMLFQANVQYQYVAIKTLFVSGTSDPYVKFKIAGKEVFRSKIIHKNLNPVWDERVCLIVDNLQEPLYIKVKKYSLYC